MNSKRIDLNKELSDYENETEESMRHINNGIYFISGFIFGLLPLAILALVMIVLNDNSYVTMLLCWTFIIAYVIAIYLLTCKSFLVSDWLDKKWVAKYLFRIEKKMSKKLGTKL